MESIMSTEQGICFICRKYCQTELHHVFHGTANRRIAEREGLGVFLCRGCHEKVHRDAKVNLWLERVGQAAWEKVFVEKGHTEDEARKRFMELFGKNYIY